VTLAAEQDGEGAALILVHGLTATRRQVVHGSRVLPRAGYSMSSYDARGHGSSEPAPEEGGYSYAELVEDLGAVVEAISPGRRCLLAGHSMGAHTIGAYALEHPERIAALALIGPAYAGLPTSEDDLAGWDRLATGLEEGGVEGFLSAYDRDLDPRWRESILRFTRARLERHEHPLAVARAIREVPRSQPFGGLAELEFLEPPALLVASHDEADPAHPYAVADAWAARIPGARLLSEPAGESPLAWQGGRLSRALASFFAERPVADRLAD
jgi:pimeloyl-ACP methyl ester carboxylesterase